MAFERRICLFLDIMGFQEIVKKCEHSPQKYADVEEILSDLRKFGGDDNLKQWAHASRFMATQFSDSLVVSFLPIQQSPYGEKPQHRMIIALHKLLLLIVTRRFLVKGGLAVGLLSHREDKIFGQALIDAYKLEQRAIFPRILTDAATVDALVPRIDEELSHFTHSFFQRGSDKEIAINYLSYELVPTSVRSVPDKIVVEFFRSLRELIIEGLKHKNQEVRHKYEWAVPRYEESITKLSRSEDQQGLTTGAAGDISRLRL